MGNGILGLYNKFYIELDDQDRIKQILFFAIVSVFSLALYFILLFFQKNVPWRVFFLIFLVCIFIIFFGFLIFAIFGKYFEKRRDIFYVEEGTYYYKRFNVEIGPDTLSKIRPKYSLNNNGIVALFSCLSLGVLIIGLSLISFDMVLLSFSLIIIFPILVLFIRVFILRDDIFPKNYDYDEGMGIILVFMMLFLSICIGGIYFVLDGDSFNVFLTPFNLLIMVLSCYLDKFADMINISRIPGIFKSRLGAVLLMGALCAIKILYNVLINKII